MRKEWVGNDPEKRSWFAEVAMRRAYISVFGAGHTNATEGSVATRLLAYALRFLYFKRNGQSHRQTSVLCCARWPLLAAASCVALHLPLCPLDQEIPAGEYAYHFDTAHSAV